MQHKLLRVVGLAGCAVYLFVGTTVAMAESNADELTDEQRSALKQNANPVLAASLRLSDADMAWWREARVGMFIHWGLYAVPGEGEWIMHNKQIPPQEYAKLADEFTAARFDADEWARLAKVGGMRYMVLTARHHDGFSLWDSPSSHGQFTSMHAASRRDIIREYTDAARKAGLGVGIYYSPMDWRFPGYFKPIELADNAQLMKEQGYGQIRELMSNYGQIDILWYDGGWLAHQGSDADAAWFWDPIKLNTMVRDLQPKVVISPRSGWEGDFRCEEGTGEIKGPIRRYAWEKCLSIGGAWGYTKRRNALPSEELIRHIVNAAVRDGNILLNVGPDPEGVVPPDQVARVQDIGRWLGEFGESIYGTRGGPFEPVDGVYGTTYRQDRIYVHVLKWPDEGVLTLPALPGTLVGSRVLTGGTVAVEASERRTVLTPQAGREWPIDTIVELQLDRAVRAPGAGED